MDTMLQSDIFFFVTTVVVVLIGILVATICISVVGILRHIKSTARILEHEAEDILSDVRAVRMATKKVITKTKKHNA